MSRLNWPSDPHDQANFAREAARTHSLEGLRVLVDAYLHSKQAGEATRVNYRSRLKVVVQFIDEERVDLLHPEFDLGEHFLRVMHGQFGKLQTIRAYATVLRSLYEALAWAKVLRFDPFFMVDISHALKTLEVSDASLSGQPEVKTIQVELYLRVENNNKFVRGKGRSREEIEQQVLARYGMQKRSPDSWTYLLTIPYTTDEELETTINDLFQEAESIADLRNGFTEGDMQEIGGQGRSW